MESDVTGAHLAWANTLNGEQDVYYSHIVPQYVAIEDHTYPANTISLTCFPNPCREQTTIRYSIPVTGAVNLDLYDIYGKKINTLLDQIRKPGIYSLEFQAAMLPAGYYYLQMRAGSGSITKSLVLID